MRRRARILLGAAVGRSNREIARSLRLDPATVSFWRKRFTRDRLQGELNDAPRSGRRPRQSAAVSERVLRATFQEVPPHGTRWTTRTLASHLGLNHMRVYRIWKANGVELGREGLKPVPSPPLTAERHVGLFGVLLQPGRRVVVLGVGGERAPRLRRPRTPPTLPRSDISGGFMLRPAASDVDELVAVLERTDSFVVQNSASESEGLDPIQWLEDLSERTPPSTLVHVFAESSNELESERLAAWRERHPRYELHTFPPGADWLPAIRSFLEKSGGVSGGRSVLTGLPWFVSAATRFAAGTLPVSRGLRWSSPLLR